MTVKLSQVNHAAWWVLGLRGVVAIGFGAFLVFSPANALLLLLQILALYLLAEGGVRLFGVLRNRAAPGRLFNLILGGLGVGTGVVVVIAALLNLELADWLVTLLGVLIGGQALFAGVLALLTSRKQAGMYRVVLFFGGIAALLLGGVTLFTVLSNSLVLVPVIGVVAIAYGGAYIFLAWTAFQLQSKPYTDPNDGLLAPAPLNATPPTPKASAPPSADTPSAPPADDLKPEA